jgi:predicted  nucleic acid-binding Zn-ribbon protein
MRALSLTSFMIAVFALGGAFLVSSAAVAGDKKDREVLIDIGGDGDLLQDLIDMDAADIEEMRGEFAEARADIKEAIGDIEEAREDVKGVPGGGVILKIAFATARSSASVAIDEALADAREEITRAERDLKTADVSADEKAETQAAITTLREELDSLQVALEELIEALRA